MIAAIDEYAKGGSGSAIAIRAVLATAIERMLRDPDMSDEAKRELKAKALAKIATLFAMGAVKGRLDAINESALASNLKKVMDEGLFDLVKRALDEAID